MINLVKWCHKLCLSWKCLHCLRSNSFVLKHVLYILHRRIYSCTLCKPPLPPYSQNPTKTICFEKSWVCLWSWLCECLDMYAWQLNFVVAFVSAGQLPWIWHRKYKSNVPRGTDANGPRSEREKDHLARYVCVIHVISWWWQSFWEKLKNIYQPFSMTKL